MNLRSLLGFSRVTSLELNLYLRLKRMAAFVSHIELGKLGVQADASFEVDMPLVDELAKSRAASLLGRIGDTYGDAARDAFSEAQGGGGDPYTIAAKMAENIRAGQGTLRRVARSETRAIYNLAALETWRAAGIKQVRASDGSGGLTGKSDPDCRARNGKIYTIDEAIAEEHSPITHPNCTLGFSAIVPDGGLILPDDTPLPPIKEG